MSDVTTRRPSLWLDELSAFEPRPALPSGEECDVIVAGGGFRGPWPASHLTEYPRLSVTDDCTPNNRGDHGLATAHGCLHQGMTAALVTGPHTTPATGRTRAERSSDE